MEIVELAIMRGFAARGHDVHCIVNGWNDGDFIARLTEAGIPHTVAFTGKVSLSPRPKHLWWTVDALRHLRGARRTIRQQLEAFRPDVIVACNRDTVLALWGELGAYPVVYHLHEAPVVTRRNQGMMAALMSQCELVVTVSKFVGDRLVDLEVAPEKVRVVHNGIPHSDSATKAKGVFTIGICGQIGSWKGHEDLVKALGRIKAHGLQFRCLVFGAGDDAFVDELQRMAMNLGVADSIEWRGFVRDQDALYRELHALAVPTRIAEPFGLVAAEAGMRRIPVVASRTGGLSEIIIDGKTGYLVSVERPDELADRLITLLRDPRLCQRMGNAAQEHVAAHFTVQHMVEGHERVLTEAVTLHSGS